MWRWSAHLAAVPEGLESTNRATVHRRPPASCSAARLGLRDPTINIHVRFYAFVCAANFITYNKEFLKLVLAYKSLILSNLQVNKYFAINQYIVEIEHSHRCGRAAVICTSKWRLMSCRSLQKRQIWIRKFQMSPNLWKGIYTKLRKHSEIHNLIFNADRVQDNREILRKF